MLKSLHPHCCIFSFDYLDFDVYLNVQLFYRMAGYGISTDISTSELIVVLRGIPPKTYEDYKHVVHVYDYVKEHNINYRDYFPSASLLFYISVDSQPICTEYDISIPRYLPIFPSLWVSARSLNKQRNHVPLHIGNYKPLSDDFFQSQILSLARTGQLHIYGAKWSKVNIHSSPISYYFANRLLSQAFYCFGLMYPYQRGRSLSGRMWQGPINGCFVISEIGTNIFNCPGVIEVSHYSQNFSYLQDYSSQLAIDARSFWDQQTLALASDLQLDINHALSQTLSHQARLLLYRQHCEFVWSHSVVERYKVLRMSLRSSALRILRNTFN